MKTPSLEDMLKAGVHFGHRTSRWHPKMKPYIFGVRGGVHVIDIEQTQTMLEKTLQYVEGLVSRGGAVLYVGTKPQVTELVKKSALDAGMPYVTNRWLGGTFTNFEEIKKLVDNYLDLRDKRDKGELKKYTKLEQLNFDRKIAELEEKIGGISTHAKALPEAIFVVDVRFDKTAVMEARNRGVKVIGLVDTNVNPDLVDYIIPCNDDSINAVTLMLDQMNAAVKAGKAAQKTVAPKAAGKPAKKAAPAVPVKEESKAAVEDLDDAVKDELARAKEEEKK